MHQRDYGQFFHSGHTGQSDEDDFRISAPLRAELLNGIFTIYWIPSEDSADIASGFRIIASVGSVSDYDWFIGYADITGTIIVNANPSAGWVGPNSAPVTFEAHREIKIELDGNAGTMTITGCLTGDGTYEGDPWEGEADPAAIMRIGGGVQADGHSARGWVSLPYARVETGIGTTTFP